MLLYAYMINWNIFVDINKLIKPRYSQVRIVLFVNESYIVKIFGVIYMKDRICDVDNNTFIKHLYSLFRSV